MCRPAALSWACKHVWAGVDTTDCPYYIKTGKPCVVETVPIQKLLKDKGGIARGGLVRFGYCCSPSCCHDDLHHFDLRIKAREADKDSFRARNVATQDPERKVVWKKAIRARESYVVHAKAHAVCAKEMFMKGVWRKDSMRDSMGDTEGGWLIPELDDRYFSNTDRFSNEERETAQNIRQTFESLKDATPFKSAAEIYQAILQRKQDKVDSKTTVLTQHNTDPGDPAFTRSGKVTQPRGGSATPPPGGLRGTPEPRAGPAPRLSNSPEPGPGRASRSQSNSPFQRESTLDLELKEYERKRGEREGEDPRQGSSGKKRAASPARGGRTFSMDSTIPLRPSPLASREHSPVNLQKIIDESVANAEEGLRLDPHTGTGQDYNRYEVIALHGAVTYVLHDLDCRPTWDSLSAEQKTGLFPLRYAKYGRLISDGRDLKPRLERTRVVTVGRGASEEEVEEAKRDFAKLYEKLNRRQQALKAWLDGHSQEEQKDLTARATKNAEQMEPSSKRARREP